MANYTGFRFRFTIRQDAPDGVKRLAELLAGDESSSLDKKTDADKLFPNSVFDKPRAHELFWSQCNYVQKTGYLQLSNEAGIAGPYIHFDLLEIFKPWIYEQPGQLIGEWQNETDPEYHCDVWKPIHQT